MRILRVFPIRTSFTPRDNLIRIGMPGRGRPPKVDEVHISCTFTWHLKECMRLLGVYKQYLPDAKLKIGGPGFNDPGGPFTPGMYVRKGVTISSRGCPKHCSFCYVPKREGKLRLYDIVPGSDVQDNNPLAWPLEHFAKLCVMLLEQRKYARFVGGFDAKLLHDEHIELLKPLGIREIWLAADTKGALKPLKQAVGMLLSLPTLRNVEHPRRKLRCYVLIGRGKETIKQAKDRLEAVWDIGCLPFSQLYCDDAGQRRTEPEWRALNREWSRPAAMYAQHAD